ncbi:hypothetical protein MKQ68_12245 [Chitinophaga horti]|uniref:MG2 domain-containing protein n=1 Tax=Chitinophaga horti TaxID=2920382 RepID=A0ABY6J845_9BACT|nr:hypothetical protein [Chitinophaga horti]UYQ95870.1 hypothetical protein MKQ68_12245 [Chitinophaga horti]
MKWLICIVCLLSVQHLSAQKLDSLAAQMGELPPQTSLYLRTNKDIYIAGEDLWFSAWSLDAQKLMLSAQDKILYLQLSHGDSVMWKEMYPITNGLSQGHVYLPDTLTAGDYLLQAYSAHSYFASPVFYAASRIQVVKEPQAIKRRVYQSRSDTLLKPEDTLQLIANHRDTITFRIRPRYNHKKTVYLRMQTRGVLQSIAAVPVQDSATVKVPIAHMPRGIAEVMLFDEQLKPVTGRLVFLHQGRKLQIQFSEVKELYAPKEEVVLKIKTTGYGGKPVQAILNVRVMDQLFADARNVRDIDNYYHVSTQLKQDVYDVAAYSDSAAMEQLLRTSSVASYQWNGNSAKPLLPDSIRGQLAGKGKMPSSVMLFNYNKSITNMTTVGEDGRFYLTPEQLFTGRRFFVKYFSEKEFKVDIEDPFNAISRIKPIYALGTKDIIAAEKPVDPGLLQYGRTLKEFTVQGKGRAFGDKYLGYLDSIARFEGNMDYVGACGMLNCPACNSGKKPVEGVTYSEFISPRRNQVVSHPFRFTADEVRRQPYHYPKYTEEELLKKFKMVMTKGFYTERTFELPEDKALPDNRNTLYWAPAVVTNEQGDVELRFPCSDIRGRFIAIVEGMSDHGELGTTSFQFSVRDRQ